MVRQGGERGKALMVLTGALYNKGKTLKHLTITYNGVTLWDAPVGSLDWQDTDNGVKVEGRIKPKPAGNGGAGGLLDMITGLSKKATNDKRESLTSEDAVEEPAEVS